MASSRTIQVECIEHANNQFNDCRSESDFEEICKIGEGAYGIVFKVQDRNSNEIYAKKIFKFERKHQVMPQNFVREINNLKLMKHGNIIRLVDIIVEKSFGSTQLILEYCEYCLSEVIDDVKLNPSQIKNIMHQLLTGLNYIHHLDIIHRNVSPDNILFDSSGILKITDFGSSRKVTAEKMTPGIGVRWYQAPEILFGSENYSTSVDIWAVGCIFAELMQEGAFFKGDSDCEVISRIIDILGTPTENLWPGFSELPLPRAYELCQQPYNKLRSIFNTENCSIVSFLQKVFYYNPSKRPSASNCLKHKYFATPPPGMPFEHFFQYSWISDFDLQDCS